MIANIWVKGDKYMDPGRNRDKQNLVIPRNQNYKLGEELEEKKCIKDDF